jgi:hypothetical protein
MVSKNKKILNKKNCIALLSFHGIGYEEYNNGAHWVLDTVERIDLWPSTLKFKVDGFYGEGLNDLGLYLSNTSGKEGDIWKSVNVAQEQKRQHHSESNTRSAKNVAVRPTARKKTRKISGEVWGTTYPKKPPASYYCGTEPPWDN